MTDPIKTRPDGSIDTAHYMRLGRMARSQAAHDIARLAFPRTPSGAGSRRPWRLPMTILSVAALALPFVV